jgi:hypothetical protein
MASPVASGVCEDEAVVASSLWFGFSLPVLFQPMRHCAMPLGDQPDDRTAQWRIE